MSHNVPDSSNLSSTAGAVTTYPASLDAIAVNVACPAATALAAFLSGALETALTHAPAAGNAFILTSTQDTSDTAFAVTKGSAPAVGDMFVVTGSGSTVRYVAPISVSDAFATIAGYLTSPPNTSAARANLLSAISDFNELVAGINAVAGV